MFTMLEFMMKVKASLTVLIGSDKEKMDQIQNIYLNLSTISVAPETNILNKKSDFLQFLERDEREAILKMLKTNINKKIKKKLT